MPPTQSPYMGVNNMPGGGYNKGQYSSGQHIQRAPIYDGKMSRFYESFSKEWIEWSVHSKFVMKSFSIEFIFNLNFVCVIEYSKYGTATSISRFSWKSWATRLCLRVVQKTSAWKYGHASSQRAVSDNATIDIYSHIISFMIIMVICISKCGLKEDALEHSSAIGIQIPRHKKILIRFSFIQRKINLIKMMHAFILIIKHWTGFGHNWAEQRK